MTPERDRRIRAALLDALGRDSGPRRRADVVRAACEAIGLDPAKRSTRTLLARQLRRLEDEGLVVDGGPLIWRGDDPDRGA